MKSKQVKVRILVIYTGGTLGMVGSPLHPAGSSRELFSGVKFDRKKISLEFVEFEKIVDSTNLTYLDRLMIVEIMREKYDEFDAFVVLHGTDSLAETTSSFSMFFNDSLQKPIMVVGAQFAKGESGSEVKLQLENSIRASYQFVKNGIVGVFNVTIGDVWDGSRLVKRNESAYNAFHTPARYPVAHCHPKVVLKTGFRTKDNRKAALPLQIENRFAKRVIKMEPSADSPPWILEELANASRKLDGIVLTCKGAGQIPDISWKTVCPEDNYDKSWIDAIKYAVEKGIHVAILSPFDDGTVNLERYELGKMVAEAGGISLHSLTGPMADFKFRQAIEIFPGDPKAMENFLGTSFVGELLEGQETD